MAPDASSTGNWPRRDFPRPRCSRASVVATRPRSADLHPGETVLDLGSGGGIDVLLSAKRVGQTGKVYGLDMTEEMLALARSRTVTRRGPPAWSSSRATSRTSHFPPIRSMSSYRTASSTCRPTSPGCSRRCIECFGWAAASASATSSPTTSSPLRKGPSAEPTSAVSQARCRSRSMRQACGLLGSRTSTSCRPPSTYPGSTRRS